MCIHGDEKVGFFWVETPQADAGSSSVCATMDAARHESPLQETMDSSTGKPGMAAESDPH